MTDPIKIEIDSKLPVQSELFDVLLLLREYFISGSKGVKPEVSEATEKILSKYHKPMVIMPTPQIVHKVSYEDQYMRRHWINGQDPLWEYEKDGAFYPVKDRLKIKELEAVYYESLNRNILPPFQEW